MLVNCTCNKGYTGADGTACTACEAGSFKSVNGSSVCTLCLPGKFSNHTAMTSVLGCGDCEAGSFSEAGSSSCSCGFGYTMPRGSVDCMACAAGTFKGFIGSEACLSCSAGKYSSASGAISNQSCVLCPENSFSNAASPSLINCTCNKGYTNSMGQECTACLPGTYKDVVGTSTCSYCPPGTYSTQSALSSKASCQACPVHASSVSGSNAITHCACNRGYTGQDGQTCVACDPSRYKDVLGSEGCRLCPAGKQGSEGNVDRDSCVFGIDPDKASSTVRALTVVPGTRTKAEENRSIFQEAFSIAALVDQNDIAILFAEGSRRNEEKASIIADIRTTALDSVLNALTFSALKSALRITGLPEAEWLQAFQKKPPPEYEEFECGIVCVYGARDRYGFDPAFCNATCGDGMRSLIEECDDGNSMNGDGCSDECQIEETGNLTTFWECTVQSESEVKETNKSDAGASILPQPIPQPISLSTSTAAPQITPPPEASGLLNLLPNTTMLSNSMCLRDRCLLKGGMSVTSAQQTADAVTAVVSSTIAAVVSGTVASSVAGAVSGAGASAAGGAVGGAGMGGVGAGAGEVGAGAQAGAGAGFGPVFSMVRQVSFMSVAGRAGGQNASESNKAFSSKMNWINFEPTFDVIPRSTGRTAEGDSLSGGGRRAKKGGAMHTRKDVGSDEDECNHSECGNCVGITFVERIVTCISILLMVFLVRALTSFLYHKYRHNARERASKGEMNADMLFPAWEGEFAMPCYALI